LSTSALVACILALGALGWALGDWRARSIARSRAVKLHSRPPYYGAYVMLWTVLPALVLVLAWAAAEPIVVSNAVHASLPEAVRNDPSAVRSLTMGSIDAIAHGVRQLTAGFIMGVMLIPFVSSLSDDIINAVPQSLRDGSLGLGATKSETIRRVVLPAALPGIAGAVLLASSRAIGETMIVVLAAGIAANLTLNMFEPLTTITVKIVSQLTGDLEFNSPQTLVAFALGLTLFVFTLGLNIYALYIVRKYREQYE
jgi:ABC-type phosphate transport system permease subunit